MLRNRHFKIFLIVVSFLFLSFSVADALTITVTPNSKSATDNTGELLSEIVSVNSPAVPATIVASDGCYTTDKANSGTNIMYLNGFDVSGIPSGSDISSVVLELR